MVQTLYTTHKGPKTAYPADASVLGPRTGEFVQEMQDIFGKNVILASRIADQAQAGEILVSALLKELTESGGDIRFGEELELELKGLAGVNRVYQVV